MKSTAGLYTKLLSYFTLTLWLASCSSLPSEPTSVQTGVIPTDTPISTAVPTYTPTPVPTLTSTSTPLPTHTPLPSPTPTEILYVQENTPIPPTSPIITVGNAAMVSALAKWVVDGLTDMEWTPDGSSLAAATPSRIELYDVITREKWRSLFPKYARIREISFSPTGAWLATSSRTGTEESGYTTYMEHWWGTDLKPYGLFGVEPRGLSDMEFNSNGLVLFTAFSTPGEEDSSIEFWDIPVWENNRSMRIGTVLDISVSNIGQRMATTPDRYDIEIWDLNATNKPLYTLPTSFTGAVTQAVFSQAGTLLATAHYDGQINIWDAATGLLIRTIFTEPVVESLAFSPDGSLLVSGNSFEDNLVRIWQVDNGQLLRILDGHTSGVTQLLFSPYGDIIASGSYDGQILIWGIRS